MRIATYLNTTPEEVESAQKNIWFGISLGNSYFSKTSLEKFIPWLVQHTKEHLLIVIADDIYAINIEVLDGESQNHARNVAERKGREKESEIREVIAALPVEERRKIAFVHWKDVEEIAEKRRIYDIVKEEYRNNRDFRDYIISIVKENQKVQSQERTIEEYDQLTEYVLREIPQYVNGITYNGVTHLLQPYPGLNKFDTFIVGLQDGTLFPELSAKLDIYDKMAIIEIYIE